MDQNYYGFTMEQCLVSEEVRRSERESWFRGSENSLHRFELAVLIDQMWVTGEEALLQLRSGGQGDLPAEQHLLQAISLCRERYGRLAEDARSDPEGLQAKFWANETTGRYGVFTYSNFKNHQAFFSSFWDAVILCFLNAKRR
jgi:hypothetical protein